MSCPVIKFGILKIRICLEIRNLDLEILILLRSNKIVDTLVVHALNDVY